ncbi:MAG: UDP-N-acetylmuramoyl-tripeptide--D-alanyl-D-alanine ligase [Deltaproteobacteria bacterium]|nr:UDP-N-acetylmuramoyl-tripeptide--D-alanyl-D-alanine ligase [Myxococcales bacterium]MDP3217948.1 UDP-N-acetylmuramoyl-tripeptide--D-alanyl-D-alanine ligase [Deltaproteobacteria bacterium]
MATAVPTNEAGFTLAEVAAATGGELRGDPGARVLGVSSDTRTLTAGALFVALRGDRFDGHDHLAAALAKGAAAALVEAGARPVEGLPVVVVRDSVRALGALGAAHLARARAQRALPVIAISGAVGKTTTKELVAAALRAAYGETLATVGNLNNLIGAPFTLLSLTDAHRAAVIECGSNAPGEIARIAALVSPDVALVTNADAAHTELLGSIEAVAREEGSLFAFARAAVVGNADEPRSASQMDRALADRARWLFGASPDAHVALSSRALRSDGGASLTFAVHRSLSGVGTLTVETPLVGAAVATNIAAALCAVAALGASAEQLTAAAAAIGAVGAVPGRLQPMALRGALVLDDTYNASPRAVRAALDAARELSAARGTRLLVALGDMLELGSLAGEAHAEAARAALDAGAAVLIAAGPEMGAAAAALAGVAEVSGAEVLTVDDAAAAGVALSARVREGDVVLVKGSRGMRMERCVAALGGEA